MKKEKIVSYSFLFILLLLLMLALHLLQRDLGAVLDEHIQVAVIAGSVIVLLGLFLTGLVLSWAAQNNLGLLKKISTRFPWLFPRLNTDQRADLPHESDLQLQKDPAVIATEILPVILKRKRKRRGRPRNYPDEMVYSAVLTWENRGPGFPYTLREFLEERFGSSATGVPNVPTGTFYDWRVDVLAEIADAQKNDEKNAH